MPTETSARTQQPGAPDESDYHAFSTALSASARGRAFLAEYARRSRHADTKPLLNALERLQTSLAADAAAPAEMLVKQKLRTLLDDIGTAQNEIEASLMAIRTAKLADLIGMVEQRLAAIMATTAPDPVSPEPVSELPILGETGETRAHLAVVPPSDQPELPIPSPVAAQTPAIALVQTDEIMAKIEFVESQPVTVEDCAVAGPTTGTASRVSKELPAGDSLASIMTLSEEERIAMFT